MTSENLDLSAYDAAVVEHGLFGRARARLFEDVTTRKPWGLDLTTGILTIDGQAHPAHILGTFVPAGTFLWAWANPGAGDWAKSLRAATQLRALGDKPGYAVFRERSISDEWVNPYELAYVCGELVGGLPVYRFDTGTATMFLLAGDAPADPAGLSLAYLSGVLLDFQQASMVDMRPCVARFLTRLGFTRPSEAAPDSYARAHIKLRLEWDKWGRLTTVSQSTLS